MLNDLDVFALVFARDSTHIPKKIQELNELSIPFRIICGEHIDHPNITYRKPQGKWDAINYGSTYLPASTDIVLLNDVDTTIHQLQHALSHINTETDLVYCKVKVTEGPQQTFYRLADSLCQYLHIFPRGELMLLKKHVLDHVLPIPPLLAEDSYILFKALEEGYHADFCQETYVTTQRTATAQEEAAYKQRTTLGIYQALQHTNPHPPIQLFYTFLPIAAPLLGLAGKNGRAWTKGIFRAIEAYLQGKQPQQF